MIRYYKKEDIDEIAKIIVDDWKIAYKGIIDDKVLNNLSYEERAERIRNKYRSDKSIVFIENNDIKGYCRFGENRGDEKQFGEIYALYIKYDERNNGIGKSLVKEAMQILESRGYDQILIWCLKENMNARKFYEKIGGVEYSQRKIKIGDKLYDEICYKYNVRGEN